MKWLLHALVVFTSAFLLFLIQPIFAKKILPWFGGGAGVWAVCLVFFQTALFLGYLYSHLLQRLARSRQIIIHLAVILIIALFFPLVFKNLAKPIGANNPYTSILSLLALNLGLPFLLLSTTSVLAQSWHASSASSSQTYELYAYSNAGSILGLLSYPFLIEPYANLSQQFKYWNIAFWVYAVLYAVCAVINFSRKKYSNADKTSSSISIQQSVFSNQKSSIEYKCFFLALMGSALLVACTNRLCHEIAPFPFLWIVPLVIYLLSFVFCFARKRFYFRERWATWMVLMIGVAINPLNEGMSYIIFPITIMLGAFFCCLMVAHGEISLAKPPTEHLTRFYLAICAGGATGSALVSFVAPLVFDGYYEYNLLLTGFLIYGVWLLIFRTDTRVSWQKNRREGIEIMALCAIGIVIGIATYFIENRDISHRQRNFYGVIYQKNLGTWRALFHGSIIHGTCLNDPQKASLPISYYGSGSGVYEVFRRVREAKQRPLRVGVLGLGAGSIATHAKEGDSFVFYEINPVVVRAARELFPFLKNNKASLEIVMGDARLSLEREAPRHFDILILDAFNSDSVPVHLLTKEAFDIYLRHVEEDGFIISHISNNYLNLASPMVGLAHTLHLHAAHYNYNPPKEHIAEFRSRYVIFSRNFFDFDPKQKGVPYFYETILPNDPALLWTDHFSSLFPVLWPMHLPVSVTKFLAHLRNRISIWKMQRALDQTQRDWRAWNEKQKKRWEEWDKKWKKESERLDEELKKMRSEN